MKNFLLGSILLLFMSCSRPGPATYIPELSSSDSALIELIALQDGTRIVAHTVDSLIHSSIDDTANYKKIDSFRLIWRSNIVAMDILAIKANVYGRY